MTHEEAAKICSDVKAMMFETWKKQGMIPQKNHLGKEEIISVNGSDRKVARYQTGAEQSPVFFYIHGGGFCWGSIWDEDDLCNKFASELGIQCFSLDYPLAPDTMYPVAAEQLYETISFIVSNAAEFGVDPECVIVGGSSAGGNLSAVMCLMAVEEGRELFKCLVMNNPAVDMSNTVIKYEDRYFSDRTLPKWLLEALNRCYAEPSQYAEPHLSPLLASDELLGKLPPTVILASEIDSLRPDADEFAKKLIALGVPVIHQCAAGMQHGFTGKHMEKSEAGKKFILDAVCFMLNNNLAK